MLIKQYKFFKGIARRLLLPRVSVPPATRAIHERFDKSWLSERSFYYGRERRRVWAVQMEAAPGTMEVIMNLLQKLPNHSSILDYGCGEHQSAYIKTLGFQVHSCDILPFKKPNYTQIDPRNHQLPFSDNAFDVSVISEVIEHVEDPWRLLRELIRVTRKQIIVSTPNVTSLKSKEVFAHSNFFHWFTPEAEYHITPVFFWQMERFCKREGIVLEYTYGNHQAFGLTGDPLSHAESLIFLLKV